MNSVYFLVQEVAYLEHIYLDGDQLAMWYLIKNKEDKTDEREETN